MGRLVKESIAFQNTTFFDELTLAFDEVKNLKETDVGDSEPIYRISKIIKNHTNLNITVDAENDYPPCIDIPNIDRNNPLINAAQRAIVNSTDGLTMIESSNEVLHGTVNIKTAKVSGVFSDIKAKMYLGKAFIQGNKFSSQELAAITLHEVGHLFTYFEFITRTVRTNQVLAGLSKILDGSENQEKREVALLSAKKALKLDKLDLSQLKDVNTKTTQVVLIDALVKETRTELGYNLFAESSWEYLCDQFSARHGAGVHLATALSKIYKSQYNISYRSLAVYLAVEMIKVILIANLAFLGILFLLVMFDSQDGGGYDLPSARLKRIRDQATQYLKNKQISDVERRRILDEIESIDKLLAEMTNRKQLFTYIHEFFSKRTRDERAYRKLQYELEDIAMNDLYVKAAEFKLMGNT
ncbi:MAG: hypothetical protein ACMV1B_07175 [Prevotella sp.]